ncbi:aminotransferase class V-fold PLP-dependent enzyme [Amycolatopsis alba]|uniref:aminotransferase class V-fold PLP-dependent enzyme n=1 Tax=Amycolatopsis alba TaxID=76020 RepID=UPI00039B64B4|nr:aminotransferase class V-fold PLP-dependent enzyme [Amycolatopsis alba]
MSPRPVESRPPARVLGAELRVPLVTGGTVAYANLDYAASAPCLEQVSVAVNELLPWYASVHRGAGMASKICTSLYENARNTVRWFAGAEADASVVFTRNTTDALNLLAHAVPAGTTVLCFGSDHHAAMLPWRDVEVLSMPASPEEALSMLDSALQACEQALVVITGAANVTGEVWPVAELAAVARGHGARTVLDAAQLAAHQPLRMADWGVDWVALSGHKIYAPFGVGALVGRTDWLQDAEPYLAGGGATGKVEDVDGRFEVGWREVPARHEAGTPNVVGAHALATACVALTECGWEAIAAHEHTLLDRLRSGLAAVPGVRLLSMWGPDTPAVGVTALLAGSVEPGLLAAVLSAEHGIGVRAGAFCAHPATRTLVRAAGGPPDGQALRVSIGLGTTAEQVDRLVAAIDSILESGPKWTYEAVDGEWQPVPDPRPLLGPHG